jgi:signal transduction histidine kinase
MPEGGAIQVSTTYRRATRETPAAVRIEITDNGAGIKPDVLPHVFEPFFTTKEQGSGLGLTMSKGIVESHRGDLQLTLREGGGTRVTVFLPLDMRTVSGSLRLTPDADAHPALLGG